MKSHGGARKGAGKPAQFGKPMKGKEVMLPDEAIEFFLALGKGNLSAGVRQAWRSLTPRAADGAVVCRVVNHVYIDGVCAQCGFPEPPRR